MGDRLEALTVKIPKEVKRKIMRLSAKSGGTMSEWGAMFVEEGLKKYEEDDDKV